MDRINNWKLFRYEEVESTNDTAKELCSDQRENFYVVTAQRQTKGRGRRGRQWISQEGNLFFSLALEFETEKLGSMVLLTSLSLLQTIKTYNPNADVALKWPNDVLLNNAKISGILIEKAIGHYWVIGIGVNIKKTPVSKEINYDVISLEQSGIHTTADMFMKNFLQIFSQNMVLLETQGFDKLKNLWLKYAKDLGKTIKVQLEHKTLEGLFSGIDNNGFLLLKTETGIITITAGEIFYG